MNRRFHIYLLFVILAWNSSPAQLTEYFVSPGGYDGASGTRMAPFATIGRAKRAVRESLKKRPAGDVTVTLSGGEYALPEPLVFDELDSPDSLHSVTYRAESGEIDELRGTLRIGIVHLDHRIATGPGRSVNPRAVAAVGRERSKNSGILAAIGDERQSGQRAPTSGF